MMEAEVQLDTERLVTNYRDFVLRLLPKMTRQNRLDQAVLRQCILLSSSFLLTDTTTDPDQGMNSWSTAFYRLVDIVVTLHAKDELELETLNAASKACSEVWSVANSFWALAPGAQDVVRKIAVKLKRILDENGRTYRGERIYTP